MTASIELTLTIHSNRKVEKQPAVLFFSPFLWLLGYPDRILFAFSHRIKALASTLSAE
jgi:hypothetical protein